jgi:hypothetical protein
VLRRALDIGWAHIHGDRFDLGRIAAVLAIVMVVFVPVAFVVRIWPQFGNK